MKRWVLALGITLGAAGSAAYLVGVFGPAFIELVLARLRGAKGGADDE